MGRLQNQLPQLLELKASVLTPTADCGSAGSGLWDTLLQTARAMITHARPPRLGCNMPGLEFVDALDSRMLSDIGLEVDAVWRDPPRSSWPN